MSTRIREKFLLALCSVAVALVSSAAVAAVQVNFIEAFAPSGPGHAQIMVITQHFDATRKEIRLAARDLDTADEMTVALFLSRESGKKIRQVLRRRASGASWWELMEEFNVGASWLYRDNLLQLRTMWNGSPPRGPKVAFKPMTDARFEDLVGARVTSEYFQTTSSLVLDARAAGKSFAYIQYLFYHVELGQNASLRRLDPDRPVTRSASPQTDHPALLPVPAEVPKLPRPRVGQRPKFE